MKQRKFLLGLILSSCLSGTIFAQVPNAMSSINLVESKSDQITVSFNVNGYTAKQVLVNGNPSQIISVKEGTPILKEGAPNLPKVVASIIIPNSGGSDLEITHNGYTEYQNIDIAPSKGNLYRNVKPSDVAYIFGAEYSQNAFYPGKLAELRDPHVLRDLRGQTIVTYPYQYNPVTKVLRVYNDIQVTVKSNDDLGVNEYVEKRSSKKLLQEFDNIYSNHFVNYNTNELRYTPMEESGDLLIITKDIYSQYIQGYAEWCVQKGIKTEIVNVSTIGNTSNAIKTYISNYYNSNNDLLYVMLVGDHADVKSVDAGSTGWETKWSDTEYAFISGNDAYPEVFVGRFSPNSASAATDMNTMTQRTLEYEKYPLAGDWFSKAIGLGSDEGPGDDNEDDWQHLRNIRTELLAHNYTDVYEFYDASHGGADAAGNPSAAIISPAVNGGVSLFNYTGHGDQNTCITGDYGTNEINNATNNGKYPFVISVACNNGTFTSGTCISESWQRAKNSSGPTGAIAACGSSILMSWSPPMETQDEMTKILTEQYANNKKYTLGGLFYNAQMSCLDDYGSQGEEVMETWIFFGDVTTMIRTLDPQDLDCNGVSNVASGATSYTVSSNEDGALATVSQGMEVLGTAVVSGGSATVTFPALTSTTPLKITVTKYNWRPCQTTVTVDNVQGIEDLAGLNDVKLFPNPATSNVNLTFGLDNNSNVEVAIYNAVGQKVQNVISAQEMTFGNHELNITTSNLKAGIYFVNITVNGASKMERLVIE